MIKRFGPIISEPHDITFIPSMATLFFEQLQRYFPLHKLLLVDFDFLPDAMQGKNGPVVQGKVRSSINTFFCSQKPFFDVADKYISYSSYCDVEKGSCDIFFPTNFPALKHLYCNISTRPFNTVQLVKHSNFLQIHGNISKTVTKSGFNPLLEDYTNMIFFLS